MWAHLVMAPLVFMTTIARAIGSADGTVTVHVSDGDAVTTTPHLRQPVRIVVVGSGIVAGTSYRILHALPTESMLLSGSEDGVDAISAADVVTVPSDGRLTWADEWGMWDVQRRPDADDDSDFNETVYAGSFATRLLV